MNKKATYLGTGIISFPVLIILVIIMALFIIISMGATFFLEKPVPEVLSVTPAQENLLLQTINVKLNDGTKKEMLVFDAVNLLFNVDYQHLTKLNKEEFGKALEPLKKDNKCYFFSYYSTPEGFGTQLNTEKQTYFGELNLESKSKEVYLSKYLREIKYYYGSC